MLRKTQILLIFAGITLIPFAALAQVDFNQVPTDDLGNYEDKFQEYFYEGLKQKGIENYQRSIEAFKNCLKFDDSHAVVYYEIAKNYVWLKNFGAAEDMLKQALDKAPNNEWYLDALYGVYLMTEDYDNAVKTVKELSKFHPDYKEDLVKLYFENGKYRAALKTLDELESEFGVSESRTFLRHQIYNASGKDKDRIDYLEEQIAKNPDNESNYLHLIYRYSEQGENDKAFQTAKKLQERLPESDLAHLALYKFHLEADNAQQAISSMKVVVKSHKIEPEAKAKVLNDFIKFVQRNPEYEPDLLEVTTEASEDDSGKSDEELAQYYLQNNNKTRALQYYKKALEKDPDNFELIKNTLLIQLNLEKYSEAAELSQSAVENYPSQPIIYLVNGVANNKLDQPELAIKSLENGLDYVFDNVVMEADFYTQLSVAYKLNNNITKSQTFAKKAEDLLKQND